MTVEPETKLPISDEDLDRRIQYLTDLPPEVAHCRLSDAGEPRPPIALTDTQKKRWYEAKKTLKRKRNGLEQKIRSDFKTYTAAYARTGINYQEMERMVVKIKSLLRRQAKVVRV